MMGIAPIFFWFAHLRHWPGCATLARRPWMIGRQGSLQAVSETRFQNVVLPGGCQSVEGHYSGLQCNWQI